MKSSRSPHDIVIVTAFYKRHALSRLWLEHTLTIGAPVIAAVDHGDKEHLKMCKDAGVYVVQHVGAPLSSKFNAAMCYVHKRFPGYGAMVLGSDDFVSRGHVEAAGAALIVYDYLLPASCAVVDVKNRRAVVLEQDARASRVFGTARAVSSKVVRSLCGMLWDDERRRGLDSNSHRRVVANGYVPNVMQSPLPPVCDVKAGVNLWPYERFKDRGTPTSTERALWMVSDSVRARILALNG